MDGDHLKCETAVIDCGMGETDIDNFSVTKKLDASVGMGEITLNMNGKRVRLQGLEGLLH